MKLFSIIISSLLFLSFIGCGTPEKTFDLSSEINNIVVHSEYSDSVLFQPVPIQDYSSGIGFVKPEEITLEPLQRSQNSEFHLRGGDDFFIYLILGNGNQYNSTYLITTLLDYQQVEFEIDGIDGLLHEVDVPQQISMLLPLRLSIPSEGSHDLVVAAFRDPYNATFDSKFRMDLYGHALARRAVIISGAETMPSELFKPTIFGGPIPPDINFTPLISFASGHDVSVHPSQRQLYVDEVDVGKHYNFQIYTTNLDDNTETYLIVPLMDYHQSSFEQNFYIAELNPNEQAIINLSTTITESPQVHQIQAIILFDPYKSVVRHEVSVPFVFCSSRLALMIH